MAILDALTGLGDSMTLAEVADDAGTTGVQDVLVSDGDVCELRLVCLPGANQSPYIRTVR